MGVIDETWSIKNKDCAKQKLQEKSYGPSGLKDLLRCSILFKGKDELQKGINEIISEYKEQICMVKNGWATYTHDQHGEWVDVKIIFSGKTKAGGLPLKYEFQL